MAKERKIRCDCGAYFEEKETSVENMAVIGMVCPDCAQVTFTLEQAKNIAKLKEMHRLMDTKRQIIQIGNSKGITLPEGLNLKVGDSVFTKAVSTDSFIIKLARQR